MLLFATATVSLIVGSVLGGTAWSAVPDTGGVIHTCYSQANGTWRPIDYPSQKCKSGETLLDINQKGAKGDIGATGPAGPAGPQGPAGPKGDTSPAVTDVADLGGLTCHTHTGAVGTIDVRTGDDDVVSLVCVGPPDTGGGTGGPAPTAERCNGIDDNLNGIIDDPWVDLLGHPATAEIDGQSVNGTWQCKPDGTDVMFVANPS
jgi:hypothetical protein